MSEIRKNCGKTQKNGQKRLRRAREIKTVQQWWPLMRDPDRTRPPNAWARPCGITLKCIFVYIKEAVASYSQRVSRNHLHINMHFRLVSQSRPFVHSPEKQRWERELDESWERPPFAFVTCIWNQASLKNATLRQHYYLSSVCPPSSSKFHT